MMTYDVKWGAPMIDSDKVRILKDIIADNYQISFRDDYLNMPKQALEELFLLLQVVHKEDILKQEEAVVLVKKRGRPKK